MKTEEIVSLLLPEGLVDYFDLTKAEKKDKSYIIYLEEKNIHPIQYREQKLVSKGFFETITVQDFPLRGKACFLKVRRRKWLNEDSGTIVSRDWGVVAKGTRMTSEFAFFFKAINR